MKWFIRLLALSLLCSVVDVAAHDIGVSQARLVEQGEGRYSLEVDVGAGMAHLFGPPELPEHCRIGGNPRGIQGRGGKAFELICEGGLTATDRLVLPWRRDGIVLSATWLDGSRGQALFRSEAGLIEVDLAELAAGSGSWSRAAGRYLGLGVEHILLGFDHLLFVLGLLLLVRGNWPLIKTITAFTVAHSITLGLATLGFVHVPSRPVEAAIALSIVLLAVEIQHARQGRFGLTYRYPWIVAFGFGLLHGLGFAGALAEVGLPPAEIPVALLFFNVGVEIGQLVFIGAVLVLRWGIDRTGVAMPRVAQVAPVYLIGTLATYWLMQRVGSMLFPV